MNSRQSIPARPADRAAAASRKGGWLRLCLLLSLWLPLQLSWALAASYCGHEVQRPAQAHLGHHEHGHDAQVATTVWAEPVANPGADPADTVAPSDASFSGELDADCHVCHTAAMAWVPLASGPGCASLPAALMGHDTHPLNSLPAAPPERPQWPRLG